MFKELEVENAGTSQENRPINDFIDLYANFLASINPGPKTDLEKQRVYRLQDRVDRAWKALHEEKQRMIVNLMLDKKMLPEEVKWSLRIFNGTVVKVV